MSLKRAASHSDSWYEKNPTKLHKQLDVLLNEANVDLKGAPKALIGPHAGYKYCAKTASYAYKPFKNSN